jgi:hypothetical protein
LKENLSESLIKTERDSRDSRAGDALFLKHFSDAKSFEIKSLLSVHQMAIRQQKVKHLSVRKITSKYLLVQTPKFVH